MKIQRIGLVATGALLVAGCGEDNKVPYLDNMDEVWGQMFAPYGLYPLYPVRTDIQPGDVVVLCKKKRPDAVTAASAPRAAAAASAASGASSEEKVKGEWIRLFSLKGIGRALEEYQKTRMAFFTFAKPASASASDPLGAVTGSGSPYKTGTVPNRLGFASFPSILSYNQKRSDFGAGIPVGTVVLGGGSSSASQDFYTLEVPGAEYAQAPHSVLQRALLETVDQLTPYEKRTLRNTAKALKDQSCVPESLSVIGDVYYTRHLTVSMGDSFASAVSARAAYQLPLDSTRNAVYKAIGDYATGASAPADPASTPSTLASQKDLAKLLLDIDAVYKNADANSQLGFAGVKVGFAKSGGKGISLDYEFASPVAFGVRVYPLSIKANGDLDPDLAVVASRAGSGTLGQQTPYDSPQRNDEYAEEPEAASAPKKK